MCNSRRYTIGSDESARIPGAEILGPGRVADFFTSLDIGVVRTAPIRLGIQSHCEILSGISLIPIPRVDTGGAAVTP